MSRISDYIKFKKEWRWVIFAIILAIWIHFIIFAIPARREDQQNRSRHLQAVYYMENFDYVDEIFIVRNYELLLNINYKNPNFEKIKNLLDPFHSGFGGDSLDTIQSLIDTSYSQNLSIKYFVEEEILFALDIFEFSSSSDILDIDPSGRHVGSNIFRRNVFFVGEIYAIAINKPTGFLFSFDFPENSLDLLLAEIEQLIYI